MFAFIIKCSGLNRGGEPLSMCVLRMASNCITTQLKRSFSLQQHCSKLVPTEAAHFNVTYKIRTGYFTCRYLCFGISHLSITFITNRADFATDSSTPTHACGSLTTAKILLKYTFLGHQLCVVTHCAHTHRDRII